MEQIYYEIEGSVTCMRAYIKEHELFKGTPQSFAMFDAVLDTILDHHYSIDPEFNEDIQDMIEY